MLMMLSSRGAEEGVVMVVVVLKVVKSGSWRRRLLTLSWPGLQGSKWLTNETESAVQRAVHVSSHRGS